MKDKIEKYKREIEELNEYIEMNKKRIDELRQETSDLMDDKKFREVRLREMRKKKNE